MNCILLLASAIVLTSSLAGMAQSTAQMASLSAPITAHEANSLIKSAHGVAEYKELAGYLHQQEAEYRAKAADEEIKRDQMAQGTAGQYHKIPTPADFAQSVHELYVSKADKAAIRARHFDQLAAAPTQP